MSCTILQGTAERCSSFGWKYLVNTAVLILERYIHLSSLLGTQIFGIAASEQEFALNWLLSLVCA